VRSRKDLGWRATLVVALSVFSCQGLADPPERPPEARQGLGSAGEVATGPLLIGGWFAVDPEPAVRGYLGRAQALEGDRERAITILNEGLVAHPESVCLYEARGALYRALGFRRAAQRDFEQAVDLDPTRGRNWFALGLVRQELGLSSIALEAFGRANHLGVESVELRLGWARAHRVLGERTHAAEHYARAIELQRANPGVELLAEVLDFVEGEGGLSDPLRAPVREQVPEQHALPGRGRDWDRQTLEVWAIALLAALRFEVTGESFGDEVGPRPDPIRVAGPTRAPDEP